MKEINQLDRKRHLNNSALYYAFAGPFFILFAIFALIDIYPFGNRTLLTVDCYHQYVPFLIEFRNKILSGESLFYSWNNGLGMEYYAAFANYCSSPLNIFALLFNAKTMPVFVFFVTAVRAGLASLFMTLFLSDSERRKPDLITASFGIMYALCGWFLTDFWNIMWCDALVLLPLICYGLRRLLFKGKYLVYVISLFVAIVSNYYSGYFLCVFLILFAPIMYITETVDKNEADSDATVLSIKSFFSSAGRFVLGSILAGCMTAFLTIPTYFILQKSSATGAALEWNFKLENTLFDFLGRFFVGANPNIREGMANVYSGTLVMFMIPLFFLAPRYTKIRTKHKICYGLLATILYLSFSNRSLTFIWHGFHFPNQIPHRESFLMSFLLVYMAFMVIRNIRAYKQELIPRIAIIYLAFIFLFEKLGEGLESYLQYLFSIISIIVIGFVLYIIRTNREYSSKSFTLILTIVVLCESFVSSAYILFSVGYNEAYPSYDYYGKNNEKISDYFDAVEESSDHKLFERTEIYPNYICNIQSVYDLKGISIFSSTARESFVKYMENYGLASNGINSIRAFGLTRPTASLFGIRNAVTTTATSNVPLFFDEVTKLSDEVTVFENEDALSVGYLVSEQVLEYVPDAVNTNPFVDINDFIHSLGYDGDVFRKNDLTDLGCEGAKVVKDSVSDLCYNVSEKGKVVLNFEVTGNENESDVYVYIHSTSDGKITIKNDDESLNKTFDVKSKQIISLGTYTGEPIKVEATYNSANTGMFRVYSYEVSEKNYNEMLAVLGDNQLDVTQYSSDALSGDIVTEDESLMLLTIPYSEGFTCKIDSVETELLAVQDALCAIRIPSGKHHIEIQYCPPYFSLGVLVSITGFVLLLLLFIITFIRNHLKNKKIENNLVEETNVIGNDNNKIISDDNLNQQ